MNTLTDEALSRLYNKSNYYVTIPNITIVNIKNNEKIERTGRTFYFNDETECHEFINFIYAKGFEFQAQQYMNSCANFKVTPASCNHEWVHAGCGGYMLENDRYVCSKCGKEYIR